MPKELNLMSGFYRRSHEERLEILQLFCRGSLGFQLSDSEVALLRGCNGMDFERANAMVENVVSVMALPLGVAPHFIINGRDYFVPMATEESSVIAAASHGAKLARSAGGFTVAASPSMMIGQIQLKGIDDLDSAIFAVDSHKDELIALANKVDPILIGVGGGVRDIVCRPLQTSRGKMLIIHLLVDVCDAMGANIVNSMGEKITKRLETLTSSRAGLRIVSNLSVHRMVKAQAVWKKDVLGEFLIEEILDAYEFAVVDPFRCVTHNKGIMNGIDAVAIATGNDFRAIEAGCHAFSALRNTSVLKDAFDFVRGRHQVGQITPLTSYHKNSDGDLVGKLELPLAVGVVGGVTQCHPVAKVCRKILGVNSAAELACVMGAVGLAQNFAALRALVLEGISKGHMRLHSKNIALAAGVGRRFVESISKQMIDEENISVSRARELLAGRVV